MNEILDTKVVKTLYHVSNPVVLMILIIKDLLNKIKVDSVKVLLTSLEDCEDVVQDTKQETEEQTRYYNIIEKK